MDSRDDTQSNPFSRQHFFPDQSLLREQSLLRQQMAYLSPQQVIGVQPQLPSAHLYHGRRSSFNSSDADESRINQRQIPLPIDLNLSNHASANPWGIPYSPPLNTINPQFSYQGLPQSRWINEQNSLLSPEYRDSRLFSSHYQQLSTMQTFQQQQRETQQKSELEQEREVRSVFQRDQEALARESIIHHEAQNRSHFHRDDIIDVQQSINRQAFSPRETFNSDQHIHQSQRDMFLSKDSLVIDPYLRQSSQVDSRTTNNSGSISDLNKQNITNQSLIYYPEASATNNDNFNWQSSGLISGSNGHQYSKSSIEDSFLNNLDTRALISSQYLNSQTLINNQMTIRENVHVNKHLEDIDFKIDQHISAIHMNQQNKVLDTRKPSSDQNQQSSIYMTPRFENSIEDQVLQSDRLPKYTAKQNLVNHESITSQDAVISFNPYLNASNEHKQNSRSNEFLRNTNNTKKIGSTVSSPNQISFSQNNSVQATQNSAVNINININMPTNHPAFPYNFSQKQALQTREPSIVNSKPTKFSGIDDSNACFDFETSQPSFNATKTKSRSTSQSRTLNQNRNSQKLNVSQMSSDALVKSKNKEFYSNLVVKTSADISKQGMLHHISDVALGLQNESNTLIEQKPKMKFSSIECLLGMKSHSVSRIIDGNSLPVNESSLELARTAMEKKERISVIKPLLAENQYSFDEKNSIDSSYSVSLSTCSSKPLVSQNLCKKETILNDNVISKTPILNSSLNIPMSPMSLSSLNIPMSPTSPSHALSPTGIKPVHPSLRLQNNSKTIQNDNLKSLEPASNSLAQHTEQSISSQQNSKPAIQPVHGGKPASFSSSFSEKRISGKPLSYLQSMNQIKKTNDNSSTKKTSNNEVLRKTFSGKAKNTPIKPLSPSTNKANIKTNSNVCNSLNIPPSTNQVTRKIVPSGKPYAQLKQMAFEDNADNSGSMSSSSEEETSDEFEQEEDEMSHSSISSSFISQEMDMTGVKRKASHDLEVSGMKLSNLKKRKVLDESLILIPLQKGWRRQTRLRPVNNGEGLRGDVYYYSPCGKKLRTYPEINSYMIKNEVTDLQLDYFSFSMKLRIGEFLESKEDNKFEKLSEEEINSRFDGMFERLRTSKARSAEKQQKRRAQSERKQKLIEAKQKKKQEIILMKTMKKEQKKQEMRRRAEEVRMRKQQQADAVKEAKRLKAQNIINEKQKAKAKKEQARQLKLEKQRLAKERKQKAVENLNKVKTKHKVSEKIYKEEEIIVRNKEATPVKNKEDDATVRAKMREIKRQQIVMTKAEEKEKKRRELVMMKAYETKRRAEERERIRENKRLEKTLVRQRKLEQQHYERMIARELKKPIDDMSLKDLRPLPDIPPLPNLHISGKAYADILMVNEFIHTFGHVLDVDCVNDFPSMAELQASLLCESSSEDALYNGCQTLLMFALFDPGVSGKYSTSLLGVNLKDIELNESNISEVLRLFILSRNDGRQDELSDALTEKPLIGLPPTLKAAILAFVCNELLCGKAIGREIEKSLENTADLRRDKWILEGEMRKYKADLMKMKPKDNKNNLEKKVIESCNDAKNEEEYKDSEDEKESDTEFPENHLGDEYNDSTEADSIEFFLVDCFSLAMEKVERETIEETSNLSTVEEIEKKVKQVEQKHFECRNKLLRASHNIRGIHLGQDRYKRRYFVLPNAGGVYVEGLESGYFDESLAKNMKKENDTDVKPLITFPFKTEINSSSSQQTTSTPLRNQPEAVKTECLDGLTWFSIAKKRTCSDGIKSVVSKNSSNLKNIVAPSVEQLGQDKKFLESIYGNNVTPHSLLSKPQSLQCVSRTIVGLPKNLDINNMIENKKKVTELLEIQNVVTQEIPIEMKKGWWRITDPDLLRQITSAAHPRGMRERILQKNVSRYADYISQSCKNSNSFFSLVFPEDEKEACKTPTMNVTNSWFPQLVYASDKAVLIEVEELEEKVFSASLQAKCWHLSQKVSSSLQFSTDEKSFKNDNILKIASSHLLSLEAGIERRYLKHPFRLEKILNKNEEEESLISSNCQPTTPALKLWRDAVNEARSCSQLSMCLSMLNACIAWEKSIMKVFCILCRKSDNEDRLLLCDACDRGCHMYCCKPKLEAIPDGDWFCPECILMASGSDQCYSCGAKTGKRIKCAFCPRYYHLQCLEPPLNKSPRSPWSCPVCKKLRLKSKVPQKKKPCIEQLVIEEEQRHKIKQPKDMELCKQILSEMDSHEQAWPFLVPVNNKQFPEYYQVIKHPMDFQTIECKLRENQYKNREEFTKDTRLVFKNCNIFNEDFSEVGKAGKIMSRFFEKRWLELCSGDKKQHHITKKEKTQNESRESHTEKRESSISGLSSSEEVSFSESESSEVEDGSDNG